MRSELDFSRRAHLSEWMDEPCSYEQFRGCLRDLARVNVLTMAHRPTLIWFDRLVAHLQGRGALPADKPLRIVDVGSGQGDLLRALGRWARRRGLAVQLTGIDLNPYAARAAQERPYSGEPISWLTGDAFSLAPEAGVDVVISSLFTHHLRDMEIVQFLGWMERNARLGWFINDLHRAAVPFYAFKVLAGLARWHPFVRHDGLVSIRRSFSLADWQRYLGEAEVKMHGVRIETFRPARLCVGRIRP